MQSLAERIIDYNKNLRYTGSLPPGFAVLNPFLENPASLQATDLFYNKYYKDNKRRRLLIGINPGRHGAGLTGIPFTDTKRLSSVCGIHLENVHSHEPSSVFMYEMIEKYGGADKFYADFYINSPFPLAIVQNKSPGKWLNANYYDDRELIKCVEPFMIASIKNHLSLGLDAKEVFVLGKKNAKYINQLNKQEKFFENIVVLDHPRYIQQYRSKEKEMYIDRYLMALQK